ncbi:MAG: hypothetical protein AAGF75_07940 [Cyanobacteria bacterium P01_H01_bin.130]
MFATISSTGPAAKLRSQWVSPVPRSAPLTVQKHFKSTKIKHQKQLMNRL